MTTTERMSAVKQIAVVNRREGGAAASLLWCVMGLLLPRATLLGALSPFGIALAACGGAANLPTLLCIGVGYLLAAPTLLPLRYVAAVALVAGGRWVLDALPDGGQQVFVPPLLAFVASAATGIASLMGGGADGYRLLLILAESAAAAGAALCLDRAVAFSREPTLPITAANQAAMVATLAVAVCAAATVEVGGFSLGRAAAALIVLLCARGAGEAGGCIAGCVLGGGLALTTLTPVPMAAVLTFGGLLAGVFSRFGRVVQGAVFLLGGILISLTETDMGVLTLLYELFCAVVIFCLLPHRWEERLLHPLVRHHDLPAAEGVRRIAALRLQVACDAMREVSRCVEEVSRRLSRHGAADMAALYRGCATAVCAACPMRGVCWELHREDTLTELERLTPLLREGNEVTAAHLKDLPISCRRADALATHLTRSYGEYLAREEAWHRLDEIRQAVERQFRGTGELLSGLVRQLQDRNSVDTALSDAVMGVCEDYGMAVEEALCTRDERGRLTVHLLTQEDGLPEGKWQARLAQVCGCALTAPSVAVWGERVRITLTQPPRYRIESGIAQRTCTGETLCGDTAQVSDLSGGVLAVLSDGMGCGGRAAVDSTMAAGIAHRLWQADFTPSAILETVNAALLVKGREESLATLDVAQVDTLSGRMDLYKAGAAPTLLKSGGRISRLENAGLPVGILPDCRFAHSHDTLSQGDILLMVSDGALCGGLGAVEEILAAHPDGGSMAALAQTVVDAAIATQGEHPDDITAIALRLCRPEED